MSFHKVDKKRAEQAYTRTKALLEALHDELQQEGWTPTVSIQQGLIQEAFTFCRLMSVRDHVLYSDLEIEKRSAP